MKTHCQNATAQSAGFSFIEAILTISIVGIMGSMIVSAITNASRDAHRIVARQQQASVQAAVNSWVMSQMRDTTTGQVKSIKSIRDYYNSQPTFKARLSLLAPSTSGVGGYLDKTTSDHFLEYTDNTDRVESSALEAGKQHLELPDWEVGGFPQVLLITR
jgi:type II secretory pathway pseudopilin PulG